MKKNAVLTIWGSCSGTEPIQGRHHTAITIEHDGKVYWFDTGETCSYNAHIAGLDLLATEAIFISHTHMDHIGGLPNLLWSMRKLTTISDESRERMTGRQVDIFIPDLEVYAGIHRALLGTENGFVTVFDINAKICEDGLLYDQNGIKVVASHNAHFGTTLPFKSFSFRIEVDGKVIVYSGDVRDIRELEPILDGCNYLLMETGHHSVESICKYLNEFQRQYGTLVLVHHGTAVLRDPAGSKKQAEDLLGKEVILAEDGMSFDISHGRKTKGGCRFHDSCFRMDGRGQRSETVGQRRRAET